MADAILVVDDSRDNRELLQILLEAEGFEVRLAEDAGQAIESLQSGMPELVLMDIQLPGIDGLELTRRIRANPDWAGLIIVALSAYAMAADKERARLAGCDGYITKPIDTRTLAKSVRQYLNAPRSLVAPT